VGHTVAIGDSVRLANTEPCPRCVMITLPQGDLPKDSGILRTAAQHNGVNVGVDASVARRGTIRPSDAGLLTRAPRARGRSQPRGRGGERWAGPPRRIPCRIDG